MWELFADYVFFLLKIATLLVAVVVFIIIVAAIKRSKSEDEQLQVQELNERQQDLKETLQEEWLEEKNKKQIGRASCRERV